MALATDTFNLTPGLRDFISGAVAGAFAITVSQPLDTVRVRLQQAAQSSGPNRNALGVLLTMVHQEGIMSPFRGLTYPLLFASVQSAVLFQAYGWTLRQMASPNPPLPPQQPQQQPMSAPYSKTSSTSASASAGPRAVQSSYSISFEDSQSLMPATSQSLHQLHLHHHHHLQDQEMAAVHPSPSVSGRLLTWMTAQLTGLGGTAPPPLLPTTTTTTTSMNANLAGSCSYSGDGSGDGGISSNIASSSSSCSRALESEQRDVGCGAKRSDNPSSVLVSNLAIGKGPRRQGRGAQPGEQQQQTQTQQEKEEQKAALPTPWHGLIAGSVAGFAQVFLWSPVELLKLRAQLQTATPGSVGYRNPAALAAQVLKQDGIAGLYRGFTLTIIRDVPSYAMYFWLYHDIAGALSPGIHPEAAPPTTQVLAGGLAGVIAWLPIYPLDVLKTRVQAVTASASQGKGWLQFVREMYKEAGVRAFFRGVAPTLVRAFLMDGASFLGYTTTLKLLGGGGGSGGSGGSGGGALAGASDDSRQQVAAAAARVHV